MGWHDEREIANYWSYAENFVLQDRMFGPTDSWTVPAHLFLVSGWSARCQSPWDPMSCVSDVDLDGVAESQRSHPMRALYAWTDITYLLAKHDVSWAWYVHPETYLKDRCPRRGPVGTPVLQNVLPGFTTVHENHQLRNIQRYDAYFEGASSGTLPAVSWIMPGAGISEHPSPVGGIDRGQAHVTRLVNAAMQGPVGRAPQSSSPGTTRGGFYDHVVPPVVDVNGYGLRVPGLMISPWAKAGLIDHQVLSFDAYLKFIEDRFLGGERINSKTSGRPDPRPTVREDVPILGDIRKEFDFTQEPLPPLILQLYP